MNPFEKIFNYQLLSRLEDSGTYMNTSQERSWLKFMLLHPAAEQAFTPLTLQRLRDILGPDQLMDTTDLLHKAASEEKQVYHPLLRPIRRAIMNKQLLKISYGGKNGRTHQQSEAFPYKLEYSMVKREWYMLWYDARRRTMMNTKLAYLSILEVYACPEEQYEHFQKTMQALIDNQKRSIEITVVKAYNEELSRILYAFSCFEKDITYDTDLDEYKITLSYIGNEGEYVLSKTRFLGKRVRIAEGGYMRQRMLESAEKALQRYGEQH